MQRILTSADVLTTIFELAERILKLIRPRFYNRLTWIVVGTGVILTATPWWGDLANALAHKYLGISLQAPAEHAVLGVVLVAIGLTYHILAHSIHELVTSRREYSQKNAYCDHDRNVFLSLQAIVPEQQLLAILSEIATLHNYWTRYGTMISDMIDFLRAPSTQFIDEEVASAANDLTVQLSQLRNFMSLKFFEHMSPPEGDMRFCMFPEGNIDRSKGIPSADQLRRYGELSDELERYVRDSEGSYAKFRSTVKRRLAV